MEFNAEKRDKRDCEGRSERDVSGALVRNKTSRLLLPHRDMPRACRAAVVLNYNFLQIISSP